MKKVLQTPWVMIASLVVVAWVLWQLTRTFNPRAQLPRFGGPKPGVLTLEMPERVVVDQPFTVTVTANTQGQVVNAAGIYIHFEPSKLRLLDMDTQNSFCQFYPEKRFDNNIGTISLSCGSPHPGFKGENQLLTLRFMPLSVGTSVIRTAQTSKLLLSDGKGTNILTDYPLTSIRIDTSF